MIKLQWFRKIWKAEHEKSSYGPFKNGADFAGGREFPLLRGKVKSDKIPDAARNYMYVVK